MHTLAMKTGEPNPTPSGCGEREGFPDAVPQRTAIQRLRGRLHPQLILLPNCRAQELCESRGGRPGLPSLVSLRFLWTYSNTQTSPAAARKRAAPENVCETTDVCFMMYEYKVVNGLVAVSLTAAVIRSPSRSSFKGAQKLPILN